MKAGRVTQKTLLTPREASQRLSVSVATIYWWYAMGKIDGVNISGGTLRLFARSLQDFSETRGARHLSTGSCDQSCLEDAPAERRVPPAENGRANRQCNEQG